MARSGAPSGLGGSPRARARSGSVARPGARLAAIAIGAALSGTASSASATWSIVAVDPETQEVGVAVASCVEAPFGTTLLPQVPGLAPGIGALAAQAQLDPQTRDLALDLLLEGHDPQAVIDMVVAADPNAAVRQYGVVDLDLSVAAFTGDATMEWAGHVAAEGVSVQGNILYGPEVVADALAAFEAEAPRCPWTLADRLMVALEAGAAQGGDNRCSKEQSALAADLMVARPGDPVDAPYLDLRIASQPDGGDNPVVLLRVAYDTWREANPPDDAACAGTSTGTDGGGDTTAATGASTGLGSGGIATAGASEAEAGDDARPPATSTRPAADSTGAAADRSSDGRGCGCDTGRTAAPMWIAGLWGLTIAPRRRQAARRSV